MPKTSPRQMMKIIEKIDKAIWNEYKSYQMVKTYILKWQEEIWDAGNTGWNGYNGVNFEIVYKDEKEENINLIATLHNMDDELLFKIAVDFGVEIPNIIYAVPEIISYKSTDYKDVNLIFEEAFKKVYEDPSHSIALANSALETVIKKICQDERIELIEGKKSLYKLTQHILKVFKYFPNQTEDDYIRNIGSSILNIAKNIEDLRSNCTKEAHGRLQEDYIIDDPLYAQLFVNTSATLGLFLLNFYEKKFLQQIKETSYDNLPF